MVKKKGRRNNGSGSTSFNARAKAQRQKRNEEYYDDYLDSDDDFNSRYDPRFNPRYGNYRSYYGGYQSQHDTYWSRYEEPREQERVPEHDHSQGAALCPLCSDHAELLLRVAEHKDQHWIDDALFALNWGIYGGIAAVLVLYHPSNLARDSDAHWLIRSPWVISWHCMAVSSLVGLILKYCFIKPFMHTVYDDKLSRTLLDTLSLRAKHIAELEKWHIKKLCWGIPRLFILGVVLAMAGAITLVLGRFGTVLHGSWETVEYIILPPLRFAKWVLRGIVLQLNRVVRFADRVARAAGRNSTKSGAHLLSFAKLYGRTLAKFSQSLLVFAIDLAQLLLLTAVPAVVTAVFYVIYTVVSRLIFGDPPSETPSNAQSPRGSPKDAPSAGPSDTSPPAYESLNGDLPAGNLGKKNKQRRKKHKEGVDAS
ncbi:hypothetical protein PENSPDRAFT_655318 [Peniophora sp. CONT]|nr:hypothetical protein PENSPDRAFT_655318 [Peniophora sp. CONT]